MPYKICTKGIKRNQWMQLIKTFEMMSTVAEVRRLQAEEEDEGCIFYSSIGLWVSRNMMVWECALWWWWLCALDFPTCKMGTVIPAGIDGDCQVHSHDRVIAPPGIHRWFPQSWLQGQSCKTTSVTLLADHHGVSWWYHLINWLLPRKSSPSSPARDYGMWIV